MGGSPLEMAKKIDSENKKKEEEQKKEKSEDKIANDKEKYG
jgi:hypothetical protein